MAEIKNNDLENLDEFVPITLFGDDDKYSEPLDVGVNSGRWRIQRGVEVMIPRYVYIRIQDMQRAEADAARSRVKLSRQFEQDSKRF